MYLWIVLLACWNVLYTLLASDLWVLIYDVKAQLTDVCGNGNGNGELCTRSPHAVMSSQMEAGGVCLSLAR